MFWPLKMFVYKLLGWSWEVQHCEVESPQQTLQVQAAELVRWFAIGLKRLLLAIFSSSAETSNQPEYWLFLLWDWSLFCSRRWSLSLGPSAYLTKADCSEGRRNGTVKNFGEGHVAVNSYLENELFWLKYPSCHLLYRESKCYKWLGFVWCWSQQITHLQYWQCPSNSKEFLRIFCWN